MQSLIRYKSGDSVRDMLIKPVQLNIVDGICKINAYDVVNKKHVMLPCSNILSWLDNPE